MNIDTSKIQEILGSDQVKSLLPYLLAGTGGAVLGGAMTGGRREDEDESRMSHLGRILRNAAITGGLAAGSTALIRKGLDSTYGAVDKANPVTGSAGNEGPASTLARSIAFSPLTAGVSGAAGLAATDTWKSLGAGRQHISKSLAELENVTGANLGGMGARQVAAEIQKAKDSGITSVRGLDIDKLRQQANLPSGKSIPGAILSTLVRRGPLSTFGATHGRRIGRGALGLAAAGLPALIGALVTNDPESK